MAGNRLGQRAAARVASADKENGAHCGAGVRADGNIDPSDFTHGCVERPSANDGSPGATVANGNEIVQFVTNATVPRDSACLDFAPGRVLTNVNLRYISFTCGHSSEPALAAQSGRETVRWNSSVLKR